MIATGEAAKILGVSQRRVVELVNAGQLKAVKTGGIWLVDEKDVELRAQCVNKKGGRPQRGSARNETRFMLRNRTYDIMELVYNAESREFTYAGGLLDASRAPIGLASGGAISLAALNSWWRNRGIPGGRANLTDLLRKLRVRVPDELVYRNLGLSLSDQYWIAPLDSSLDWHDVNFFENDFTRTSELTAPFAPWGQSATAHPDNTSDGNLAKHWTLERGKRLLKKAGLRNNQEPFNEVVATALHRRLLDARAFVSYEVEGAGQEAECVCANFLSSNEEYVSAFQVANLEPQAPHASDYDHYVSCCAKLGMEIEEALFRMIVCDDIIANTDRHYRNFGIVRNVDTLECRAAPIFDSGTSLWCTASIAALKRGDYSFKSKQFYESPQRQLLLVEDFSWLDSDKLDGFADEAIEILSANDALSERLPHIHRALEHRVARIQDIAIFS